MMLAFIDAWDTTIQSWAAALGWPLEGVLRLAVAAVLGGLIGLERELRGRQAGFRTNMLVCIGSALVMIVSIQFATHPWKAPAGYTINIDPARIAYGVMTGVGFLGAGTIIHQRGSVRGLTTAAGVWCVAAVGLAAGFGMYLLAILATVLIVLALWAFDYLELILPEERHRRITLRTAYHPGCVSDATALCRRSGVEVYQAGFERTGDLSQADVLVTISYRHPEQLAALEKAVGEQDRFEMLEVRVE